MDNSLARPDGPGSREPSPSVSAESGFDPSRIPERRAVSWHGEVWLRIDHAHLARALAVKQELAA